MNQASCSLKLESNVSTLTVGQKFHFICRAEGLKGSNYILKDLAADESIPKLSLLEVTESENGTLDLLVTSYKAGQHSLNGMELVSGEYIYALSGDSWTVESVLQQGQEPYPAYEAVKLEYPYWFYAAALLGVIFCLSFPFLFYFNLKKQKRIKEKIDELSNVSIPLDAFYRSLRKLEKQKVLGQKTDYETLQEIQKEVRIYITREFQVPAFEWKSKQIFNYIKKKYFKMYKQISGPGIALFKEYDRATEQDLNLDFFIQKTQSFVEAVDRELTLRRKKK